MLRTGAADRERATAIPRRSPLTRVTCALFIATSVPVPMAMPTSALAVVKPSPVARTIRRPDAVRLDKASGVLSLIGSDTDLRPASLPSTARCITLAPLARSVSASGLSASTGTPICCIRVVLPNASA